MATVECTPAVGFGKTPLRRIGKNSDYPRVAERGNQGSKSRSKTAAERLEADKLKYVKSSKARQQRFTLEFQTSASPHNDSTGTHSMGTASTGSPINMEEDDISDYVRCESSNGISKDIIHRSQSNGTFYSGTQYAHRSAVRSSTDTEISQKSWPSAANQRSKLEQVDAFSPILEKPSSYGLAQIKSSDSGIFTTTSDASEVVTTQPKRTLSPKDNRGGKSFSSYFTKAKEGIKTVTSAITNSTEFVDNNDTPRTRQPRSTTVSRSSKFRSASVGANVYRNCESSNQKNDFKSSVDRTISDNPVMSPRTQLKQARQNLKKVDSNGTNGSKRAGANGVLQSENNAPNYVSPAAKFKGKTFTVIPRQRDTENSATPIRNSASDGKVLRTSERSTFSTRPNHLRSRPLSVIENRETRNLNFLDSKSLVTEAGKPTAVANVIHRRSSSSKEENFKAAAKEQARDEKTGVGMTGVTVRRVPSQRLKRRSWDLAHTMDNSLHLAMEKPASQQSSLTPDPDMVLVASLKDLPQQRDSWSKAPLPSDLTGGYKRNLTSRISYHEDVSLNRPGFRKSITEALEEIFNPLEHDDMQSGCTAMSPDASAEAKTLVDQSFITTSTFTEKGVETTIADNIGGYLRHTEDSAEIDSLSRSKTPESSRSKTPTAHPGMDCFGANDVDVPVGHIDRFSSLQTKSLSSSSPESVGRRRNRYRTTSGPGHEDKIAEQRPWTNYQETPVSQPLSRVDLAPVADSQVMNGIPSSPMLAPRSRREVAPDCNIRSNTNSLSRQASRDDNLNTMRSQNTSSSASVDVNKPFTALTANDLKPRRNKRNMVNPSVPLKPTYPYLAQQTANNRSNSKRHTNAPVSPTMSPHKQPARMTPPHGSRSSSSTPYSSLKRTPTSSRSSSLKRNRQRSKSDVSIFQSELDRFFSTMGMDESIVSPLPVPSDTLFTTAQFSSESDFSFAGASAYVRDEPDETSPMDVDPMTASLSQVPSVSIIEKNARIMRWLVTCKKTNVTAAQPSPVTSRTPRVPVSVPYHEPVPNLASESISPRLQPRHGHRKYSSPAIVNSHFIHMSSQGYSPRHQPHQPYMSSPPPIPPRVGLPKESDV